MQQGNFYHIYNRGNNKQPIFFERKNYVYFLELFKKHISDYVDVYAYCLMPNHFHFLIKIKIKECAQTTVVFQTTVVSKKLTPVEKSFRDFFISYSKSINKAYNRTGALFQQKFKRKLIDNDSYFTSLIQYIHANPLAASLCNNYQEWEFSSYNAIINNAATLVQKEKIIDWFGSKELFIKIHNSRKLELKEIREFIFKE